MPNEKLIDALADEINLREGQLVVLRQAFEIAGGVYEEEPAAEPAKKQRKSKKKIKVAAAGEPDEFGVTIGGQFVKLRERQAAVVELLIAADGKPVSKAAINEAWGSPLNFPPTFKSINKKLASVGRMAVVAPGQGYQLQKI